jgi:hypothetical protein
MRVTLAIACVLGSAATAHADDAAVRAASRAAPPGHHLVYVELLGKAGPYGIGYEYAPVPWLAAGAAGSYAVLGGQQLLEVAPYLHVTLLRRRGHALFGELGAILAHSRIPPVADWRGMTHTGTGGFLSVGYEHGWRHLALRASASVVAGQGGLAPMAGLALGWRP